MIFQEKDVDFSRIDWKLFEELCFDLLLKYQFHSLVWKQGGHDKGRDIEALYTVTNSILGNFQERWFVECKHHKNGLKVMDIADKIEWAKAEKVNHFLLMTNSYLTPTTREWLEKKSEDLPFRIHELNGKLLRSRILAFPDLIVKYFFSDGSIAITEMLKLWVLYDILPDPKSLYSTLTKAEFSKIKPEHLIFLLFCKHSLSDELERYCQEEDKPEFNEQGLLSAVVENAGNNNSKLSGELLNTLHVLPHFMGALSSYSQNSDKKAFFLRQKFKGHFLLELYLLRQDQKLDFSVSVRKING